MPKTHICERCGKNFKQKSHLAAHMKRKRPCKKDDTLTSLIEAKVQEKVNELMNIHKGLLEIGGERNEVIYDRRAPIIRKQGLDKFYTNHNIVKKCIDELAKITNWDDWDLVVEPSAGNGSFYLNIPHPNKIGLDISPEHPSINKQDFFTFTPPKDKKKIIVIGNPPFGKVSSLAIQFFNYSTKWADMIAFIIPRTFRRISVQNQLNLNFHLLFDMDIPMKPCSFTPKMTAKCCFQIWKKENHKRTIIKLPLSHPHWSFMSFGKKDDKGQPTPPDGADFAVKAYGGKCGEIKTTSLHTLRPKSWHWIKSNIDKKVLIERFNSLDYSFSENTVRQNSIGRGEFVKLYYDKFG